MCGNNYLLTVCMLVHRIDKYLVNGKGGLGVIQNCHHFHERTQSMLGGGGQWSPRPRNSFFWW